jgi:hypothetical protein
MPALDGVDVSHYQGSSFPWAAMVQQHGITLGACKVSEGGGAHAFIDSTWEINREGMRAAGLRYRGLYHYLTPTASVADQVANFSRVGGLEQGEFIQVDIEQAGLTSGQILDALHAFESAYPGRVTQYQGRYFNDPQNGLYDWWPWWLPNYSTTLPHTVRPVAIWQWGGAALGVKVPNIGGVDSNQIIDRAAVERVCALTAPPGPGPLPPEVQFMKSGHYRDDRPDGHWQVWWVNRDWTDALYAYPIDDMPRGGDYDLLDKLPDHLLTAPFGVLADIQNRQNRPTPLDPVVKVAAIDEHSHSGGVMGPTGGVVR